MWLMMLWTRFAVLSGILVLVLLVLPALLLVVLGAGPMQSGKPAQATATGQAFRLRGQVYAALCHSRS
jgi:hypothetical protein